MTAFQATNSAVVAAESTSEETLVSDLVRYNLEDPEVDVICRKAHVACERTDRLLC